MEVFVGSYSITGACRSWFQRIRSWRLSMFCASLPILIKCHWGYTSSKIIFQASAKSVRKNVGVEVCLGYIHIYSTYIYLIVYCVH